MTSSLGLGLLSALAIAGAAAAAEAPYAPAPPIALGAPDRWDYAAFHAPTGRLYLAHGDKMTVVDAASGKVVGSVEGITGGTHGAAIVESLGKGYTDDGRAGEVVVFDLKTLTILKKIKVDPDADGMTYDPASGRVFVIEGDPQKVVAIDPKTDKVVGVVATGGKLEFGDVDGAGALYVNGEEKREVLKIDTRTLQITARFPVPDCASPHGLAVDAAGGKVFTSCVNAKLFALDAKTGAILASFPIGRGSDAVAFDAKRKRVFSSNGAAGTISVIEESGPSGFTALPDVATAVSGRTMTVDPATGRLYVLAADTTPSPTAGGRPRPVPGSLKLLVFAPTP